MTDIEKILEAVGVEPADRWGYVRLPNLYKPKEITTDLNAIRHLEMLVIEEVGLYKYGNELWNEVAPRTTTTQQIAICATVDAQPRIAAMLAALEGK
jgi:hypothetical protein